MKSRFFSRREVFLLCAPLLFLAVTGAFISRRQNQRLAEQQRRESGPLRLVVWNVRSMPVLQHEQRAGYNYSIRMDARVEGEGAKNWCCTGKTTWTLRAKSARIQVGKIVARSRIVNTISPFNPTTTLHGDVLAIANAASTSRDGALWILCDAPSTKAALTLELEAVARDAKTHNSAGQGLVAPIERFQLRAHNPNDDAANNWKNTG